jgi:hypothetical protein
MKIVSTLIVLIASTLAFAQLPTEDLRAYYPFSGNTEDEASFNDGVGLEIALTEDRFGAQDCAYEFEGTMTSLILIQGMSEFNIYPDSSCTISLWFNGGSDDAGDWESLFIKYGDPVENPVLDPSYGLLLYDLNKPLMVGDNASLWMQDDVNPFPTDNLWHHLVGVFKAGDWSIYFDNVLAGTWTDPMAIVDENASDVAIGTNFEGKLDDIAFYGRDLTVQEIDQLYTMPSACAAISVQESEASPILVYPNPASTTITLDCHSSSDLQVRDSRGRVVWSQRNCSSKVSFDITDWATGLYLIQSLDEGEVFNLKLLVE